MFLYVFNVFLDFLLCKFCGADAADLEYAISVRSPASLRTENQTLSGKQVLSQTLKNPANIYFDVITVKKSNCIGVGEWKKTDTWFPGFAWKACVCQPWGHFLGWVFEPVNTLQENQNKASERGFYALISDNILTEQFSNSLLMIPKSYRS
ncbi:hypothetical protein RUM43_000959 [Polyplax serrata]|uniref:CULT domain-containing protein n=1 Tax=Polyplax serrata TaxID=468196 RepID=A0AAN8SFH0_POLSC